ncbi:MAG: DNA mismatch repair protein MutS, partial [Bacteroidota bacterium]|nr:DNA mismatch repair protein MutS [Bacteroidota bacterium]
LGIVLTKRSNGAASGVELAGFPHHSLEKYLPKLVKAGCRVAVCDQLEDPKKTKSIVKRGVTELVTPGVSVNDNVLDSKKNNYLASISKNKNLFGISFFDISTGEFSLTTCDYNHLEKLINTYYPAEIICSKHDKEFFLEKFSDNNFFFIDDWVYKIGYSYDKLLSFFNVKNLKGFGVEKETEGLISAGATLFYLELTEHKNLKHITSLSRIENDKFMWLDKFTIRNLELITPLHSDSITLKDIIDNTFTPMGSRLMGKWLLFPLLDKKEINYRQSIVTNFIKKVDLLKNVSDSLKSISDIERITSKLALVRVTPRELINLKNSLLCINEIKMLIKHSSNKTLFSWSKKLDCCDDVIKKIDQSLNEDAPALLANGRVFKEGYNNELDELRNISKTGKNILLKIQNNEIKKTGISSLKIAYNKIFGYYLEVTNAHKDKVPDEWIRKQTLVNSERYITEELKEYEEKILNAEEKIYSIENNLYTDLLNKLSKNILKLQSTSLSTAFLDCLISFSNSAIEYKFCLPTISNDNVIDIKKGRHVIIERSLSPDEVYIPNNVYLDNQSQQIIIITGPNMAGKSALIRQTALIVLLAQIGSYVPAAYAKIGIIDKIFTRVGASDNISKGESTFMVEMLETSSIMNNLSDRSLILMDEIGRGTSTYDGISIAWSIVEFLHNHKKYKPKTLFATHYHELNQLSNNLPRVKNYNVSVKEINNEIIFLRKLIPGGSEHSFGINVAQLAGMPNQILLRAYQLLERLEKKNLKESLKGNDSKKVVEKQLTFLTPDPRFEKCRKILTDVNINEINPLQALVKLNEMIEILKSNKK